MAPQILNSLRDFFSLLEAALVIVGFLLILVPTFLLLGKQFKPRPSRLKGGQL